MNKLSQGEGGPVKFTYTEKDGDQPAYEWLAAKVKEYAKYKYGIELEIVVVSEDNENSEDVEEAVK